MVTRAACRARFREAQGAGIAAPYASAVSHLSMAAGPVLGNYLAVAAAPPSP